MGWSTDWLYKLLLDRARKTWVEAQDAASQRNEPDPDYLVATQHPGFKHEFMIAGDPIRIWTSTDDFCSLAESSVLPDKRSFDPSRSIFPIPGFAFFVSEDRRRVLISRHIGCLYASGGWFDVIGQGKRGSLRSSGSGWIS